MNTDRITIRAFRATDDRERCVRYVMEHVRVLEDVGVSNVIRPDVSWCTDPNVVVVVAEHEQLGMVAGIRLHKAAAGKTLPMELSLRGLDPSIAMHLDNLLPDGNGEIAGLWNAHRFAGHGVPKLLMEATVSLANQIGVHSLVTFIAEYVAPYASKSGFVMMKDLRDGGDFIYPVPTIRTHAMVLPDIRLLSAAAANDRQRIMSLRLRPWQVRSEKPKRDELEVSYELIVDQRFAEQYDSVRRWWQMAA